MVSAITNKGKIHWMIIDGTVNADLKQGIGSKGTVRTKQNLKRAAENHLAMLNMTPQRIMKYFDDSAIAYAK